MPKLDLNNTPNAKMIRNVQEKSVMLANSKTVQDIPLELIDENADNSKIFNMKDIERLAENIRQEGFFGTIEVYQKEDGRYEISSGHRRFKAMQMLKEKTIPATISPMPEKDTKKRRKLIASNINSRNMTPLDWARAIQYYLDTLALEDAQKKGKEFTSDKKYRSDTNRLNEAAEYFGFNYATITRYMKLNYLIPELQEMVENEIAPWTSIYLAGGFDEVTQRRVYSDLSNLLKNAVPVISEDGEETRTITGAQANIIVRKYKDILEREANTTKGEEKKPATKKIDKVDNLQKDTLVDITQPLDFDEDLGLPVYSGENENRNRNDSQYVISIDGVISSVAKELEMLLQKDYTIGNNERVLSDLAALEESIVKIKEKLNCKN